MKLTIKLLGLVLLFNFNSGIAQVSSSSINTPDYLDDLFHSGKTFAEIKAEADLHFEAKHPGLTPAELCVGDHRDGDFVKYQRWAAFWQNHLNPDGTLGDYTRGTSGDREDRSVECDDSQILMDWTNINYSSNMGLQIDQGRTSSMAFHPSDPDTYYVGGAFGGLWKTTNGGESYVNLNDELPLAAVASIIIDFENPDRIAVALSDIVWYGPSGIGVFVSTDGGITFSETDFSFELSDGERIYYMDQNPENSEEIMVASSDGAFRTTDFFETTEEVRSLNSRSVKYSQTDPSIVYLGGRSGQFYKSTDGGENFDLVTDFGSEAVRIAVSLEDGSQRVAATSGSSLYVSEDHGETFEMEGLPESNMVVEFAPDNDEIIHVGNFEVHRSDDFGSSFTPITQWLGHDDLPFIHVDQRNVFVNPLNSDFVYFCNDGGIFRYDVGENEFANLSSDLIITQYYDIAVSQTEALVVGGGSQDNGNIFRESDGEWDAYAQTGDGMGQDIDPENDGIRYWSYQYGALRRWEAGDNTNIAPSGEGGSGAWETPFKLDPNDNNRIFVGYNSVFVSDNNGDTWNTVGEVVNPSADVEQIAIAPSNSDKIYVSQFRTVYVKSPDSEEWESTLTPVIQRITDMEVDPLDEDIAYISYAGYNEGDKVYKTIDGGETWENISLSLPNLPIVSLELYHDQPGGIFVGTYGAVYYTDDRFSDWLKVGCIPNTAVNDIEIQYFTNKVFIGTHGRGMFEAPIEFNVVSLPDNTDELTANDVSIYPNPTQDVAILQTQNIDLTDARIQLSDVNGKLVETAYTINGAKQARIDCEMLAPGNYHVSVVLSDGTSRILKLSKQ